MEREILRNVLLTEPQPSRYFETLRAEGNLLPLYAEPAQLPDIPQDPVRHPEGDVWVHTMQVLDRAAATREQARQPYGFMLAALTHDFGKITATAFLKGRYHAYGHEIAGVPLAAEFLKRMQVEPEAADYVLKMIPLHMKPKITAAANSAVKVTNRMFDDAPEPEDLLLLSQADKPIPPEQMRFLRERLEIYRDTMAKPAVTAADLQNAGVPAEKMAEALAFSHKLRLAGILRDAALRQTLSMIKTL